MNDMKVPAFIKLLRTYTRYFPVEKGKNRLLEASLRIFRHLPKAQISTSRDGRKFRVDLTSALYRTLYFMGSYERNETEVVRNIIKPGNIVIDVGANFGWYTTLLAKLVGPTGEVHAFEPVPWICEELRYNLQLNEMDRPNIRVNNCALGEKRSQGSIYVFNGLSHGNSSLCTMGRKDFHSYECEILTLDDYVSANGIKRVDFLKCDVEGAEMMVIRGGSHMLRSRNPPVILIELNRRTSEYFGYNANDLVLRIRGYNDYLFYCVGRHGRMNILKDPNAKRESQNIVCVPKSVANTYAN